MHDAGMLDARDEIRRLRTEHEALEKRLDELNLHVYLTTHEQVELKRIKKLKLQYKDQIHALMRTL
ncbi:MAG: hypothetical protein AMXMBFR64_40430 [Myxococcales bacterium]